MKEQVKVAVVQFSSKQAIYDEKLEAQNLNRIVDYIEQNGKNCDLIVFPELTLCGYIHLGGYAPWHSYKLGYWNVAEDIRDSEALREIGKAVDKAGCICIAGFAERSKVKYEIFNSAALIEPGRVTRFQRKIHLPTEENHFFIPGSNIEVYDTKIGKLGIAICYDFVFPEVVRILALKGAEIVVIIANVLDMANFKEMSHALPIARAIENQVHIILCNSIGELRTKKHKISSFGESKIIDSFGKIITEAPADKECVLTGILTREELERGASFLSPFRDRKPEIYGPLTEPLNW